MMEKTVIISRITKMLSAVDARTLSALERIISTYIKAREGK
jgi:hypothetical protein